MQYTVSQPVDTLIQGAKVFDGLGNEALTCDVAISGDRIVAIGKLTSLSAKEVIDAKGLCLAPGFIDVHTHDDLEVLRNPNMAAKISQGVTTVITGNCGISAAPAIVKGCAPDPMNLLGAASEFKFANMADYIAAIQSAPSNVNVAALVGHTTLRNNVMDDLLRTATESEVTQMCRQLESALNAGALGLSTGLAYKNANFATTDEVQAFGPVLKAHNALYTTHLRTEFDAVLDAMDEAFAMEKLFDIKVIISHLKCAGKNNWGRAPELIERFSVQGAHSRCSCDAYPYAASSSTLDLKQVTSDFEIFITWSQPHPEMAERSLQEIADDWQLSLIDTAKKLQPAGAVYHGLNEKDVAMILAFDKTMIGSDGLPCDPHPHPRLWGSFPRVLGKYAREDGIFSLAKAIHKMTGLSASNYGLTDRGEIGLGKFADLVLFDSDAICDNATFINSELPASGVHRVWTNGQATLLNDQVVPAHSGKFLTSVGE
ncbi:MULTISPECIES: D-aminoacylase [unclassified Pseudoalteromonas]|uniref:N-acyl-D-amino-acid deacylase family protein n=1 Tax=unclassified Pseudoalteromonas TaxID=194690 RepID=UPI001021FEA7|nr:MULTISPECIES: D-aminoacylase [unclassified Pseudoalteromonas]MCG9709444.1 D-aminoacylase [Pseudoalteromonas sp. Isolate3]NIZ04276.1 D-aminoacylase [Pseudoalteromonas sp. HF66]RZD20297.1 D-aminoacylase [Pseudoalteromonas sp. MEBiC 03485]